jgi:hypothetical protein
MLGFIIFSYPLSLVIGLVLGATVRRPLVSLLWPAGIGVALATLLSLEYLSVISFERLLRGMILPAAAFCAILGIVGAGISLSLKALVRVFGRRT